LEETIRSVLLQGYHDLEYIVIDGGSIDASIQIIRKYAAWISHWVSERDAGQAAAINKGFLRARGQVLGWINSDDRYEPGALSRAAQAVDSAAGRHVACGGCQVISEKSELIWKAELRQRQTVVLRDWVEAWRDYPAGQPGIFFSREAFAAKGPLDERLNCAFDYDLWLRLAESWEFHEMGGTVASFRVQPDSKTSNVHRRFIREMERASRRHWGSVWRPRFWRLRASSWIWWWSIGLAYHAAQQARHARGRGLLTLAEAFARCPFAPLIRPRPFLAAASTVLSGSNVGGRSIKDGLGP
jgi:glycosyltransferase involved in cell wall biosynthesis